LSYNIPSEYYWNRGPVAYGPGFDEPVPGWGMRPNTVGPAVVGIGADPGLAATDLIAQLSDEDKKQLIRMGKAMALCCPKDTCCQGADRSKTVSECVDAYEHMSDYLQQKLQEQWLDARAKMEAAQVRLDAKMLLDEITDEIQRRKMMPLYIAGGVAAVGVIGLGVWYWSKHRKSGE